MTIHDYLTDPTAERLTSLFSTLVLSKYARTHSERFSGKNHQEVLKELMGDPEQLLRLNVVPSDNPFDPTDGSACEVELDYQVSAFHYLRKRLVYDSELSDQLYDKYERDREEDITAFLKGLPGACSEVRRIDLWAGESPLDRLVLARAIDTCKEEEPQTVVALSVHCGAYTHQGYSPWGVFSMPYPDVPEDLAEDLGKMTNIKCPACGCSWHWVKMNSTEVLNGTPRKDPFRDCPDDVLFDTDKWICPAKARRLETYSGKFIDESQGEKPIRGRLCISPSADTLWCPVCAKGKLEATSDE